MVNAHGMVAAVGINVQNRKPVNRIVYALQEQVVMRADRHIPGRGRCGSRGVVGAWQVPQAW